MVRNAKLRFASEIDPVSQICMCRCSPPDFPSTGHGELFHYRVVEEWASARPELRFRCAPLWQFVFVSLTRPPFVLSLLSHTFISEIYPSERLAGSGRGNQLYSVLAIPLDWLVGKP